MKKTRILMAAAILLSLSAAMATKSNQRQLFATQLQGSFNQSCTEISADCNDDGLIACQANNIYEDNTDNVCRVHLSQRD